MTANKQVYEIDQGALAQVANEFDLSCALQKTLDDFDNEQWTWCKDTHVVHDYNQCERIEQPILRGSGEGNSDLTLPQAAFEMFPSNDDCVSCQRDARESHDKPLHGVDQDARVDVTNAHSGRNDSDIDCNIDSIVLSECQSSHLKSDFSGWEDMWSWQFHDQNEQNDNHDRNIGRDDAAASFRLSHDVSITQNESKCFSFTNTEFFDLDEEYEPWFSVGASSQTDLNGHASFLALADSSEAVPFRIKSQSKASDALCSQSGLPAAFVSPDDVLTHSSTASAFVSQSDSLTQALQHNQHDAHGIVVQDGERKQRVTFDEHVEVILTHGQDEVRFCVLDDQTPDMLRNFWHLHGQISYWDEIVNILERYHRSISSSLPVLDVESNISVTNVQHIASPFSMPKSTDPHEQDISKYDHDPENCPAWRVDVCPANEHPRNEGLQELHAVLTMARQHDGFRRKVTTWFLAKGRFQISMRPRDITLHEGMTVKQVIDDCRSAWFDLDNGDVVSFFIVRPKPPSGPTTVAHVVLIQGEYIGQKAALYFGQNLPVLRRMRAVLYNEGCTVEAFFREAQHPEACNGASIMCFVKAFQDDNEVLQDGPEILQAEMAALIVGDARVIPSDDTSEEDEISSQGDSSTDLPDDESILSDLPHSWERHGHDSPTSIAESIDLDETSFVSGIPHLHQFDVDNPYPWENDGLGEPLELEAEQDDLVLPTIQFAQDHQGFIQDEIEQLMSLEEEDETPWIAATFGLGLVDLGRRDVQFQPHDLEELRDNILQTWADHAAYGDLIVYNVHPQPLDQIGSRVIALLVVVDLPESMDNTIRHVLVVEQSEGEVQIRRRPYGARLTSEASDREIMAQLSLHTHCLPFALRICRIRLGTIYMEKRRFYEFEHGTLCRTWIGNTFSQLDEAEQTVINVEQFFLQAIAHSDNQDDDTHPNLVCWLHGVSPENTPLGHRVVIIPIDYLFDLDWIGEFQAIWPFGDENVNIFFVSAMTAEMLERETPVFHFIVKYGLEHGTPILVRQQIIPVDQTIRETQGADELWAISVPAGEASVAVVQCLTGWPFWFQYGREQNVYPHLSLDGTRLLDIRREWRSGDLLKARFMVWDQRFALTLLMGSTQNHFALEPEHTSFLQIRTQQSMTDVTTSETANSRSTLRSCYGDNSDPIELQDISEVDDSHDVKSFDVSLLREGLRANMDPLDSQGTDTIDPPFLQPDNGDGRFEKRKSDHNQKHFATSSLEDVRKHACQIQAWLDEHEWTCHATAFSDDCGTAIPIWSHLRDDDWTDDAEATALAAAAEFILTRKLLEGTEVHLHYDAQAVGQGSTGQAAVIQQDESLSTRQKAARILVHLAQRSTHALKGLHTHAHCGQPWNEMADSLAKSVRLGWTVTTPFRWKSKELMAHPLVEWAWLLIRPTAELPDLAVILENCQPNAERGHIDHTLQSQRHLPSQTLRKSIFRCATANVGTLEQDVLQPGAWVTCKANELMHQFEERTLHCIAIQEGRARHSRMATHGPFTCLISAADAGIGGVELWFNHEAIRRDMHCDFDVNHDTCVWFATSRIMAVRCHFGGMVCEIITAYAPQQGRGQAEVNAWWPELEQVCRNKQQDATCILMGDLNCRVGSVTTEQIGTAGADLEDLAGTHFRELCSEYKLLVPSTWDNFHSSQHSTFTSSRGTSSRLDFIAISEHCAEAICDSFVDATIDLLNGDRDHNVLILELALIEQPAKENAFTRKPLYNRDEARRVKASRESPLIGLHECPWELDVNEHWSLMRDHLQNEVKQLFPLMKRQKRQLYFSERAWTLVCQRKELRQEHRSVQRAKNCALLKQVFAAWRKSECMDEDKEQWMLAQHMLCMQEALILRQRQKLDQEFRQLKRTEWKAWVEHQLESKIQQMKTAKASDIYRILKPKRIVDKKRGKDRKPLPGLKDQTGQWRSSRADIAMAWDRQFAEIELAEPVQFEDLLSRSEPKCDAIEAAQLLSIPSFFDVERSVMQLKDGKAPGLDGLGAEVWQMGKSETIHRIFAVMLKAAMRKQSVPEWSGGWLLPLHKKKSPACCMEGYRAILLEPTIARAVSRSWRGRLVEGLNRVSAPLQQGGRKGLGIEPMHLMLKLWQSNAKHRKCSLGLIFVDIRSAFYRVVKPMLATMDGTLESLAVLFRDLKMPSSAMQEFMNNIGNSDMVRRATESSIIEGHVAASLATTWFLVPHSKQVHAPRTGSRPGDPSADILFGFVMAHLLEKVHERSAEVGIQLVQDTEYGPVSSSVAWVDDLAIGIMVPAEKLVMSTCMVLSILIDVATEHGLQLSYGKGKTAAMLDFRGKHATKSRQEFEQKCGDVLPIASEHWGITSVPVLGHYRHLGGILVPNGSLQPELHARAANMKQNISPLKTVLANQQIDLDKRRMLLRSLGLSVIRLHCSTWFNMTQGEADLWHSVVFRTYHYLERRQENGEFKHKKLLELACQLNGPMPMEFLYIERLRLLVHILGVFNEHIIAAILQNFHVAGKSSWLYGVHVSLRWARTMLGDAGVPEEMLEFSTWDKWHMFRDVATDMKKMVKSAEKAHILRIKTYDVLNKQGQFQRDLFLDMGWEHHPTNITNPIDIERTDKATCEECNRDFESHAALATHQQRKHGQRIALRRVISDGACRACKKFFHSRVRLLGHLHRGQTNCWCFHMRRYAPMSMEDAKVLDEADRCAGEAFHQGGLVTEKAKKGWRWATEAELVDHLAIRCDDDDLHGDPSEEELAQWATSGLLPPGRGGRPTTIRQQKDWKMPNVMKAIRDLEDHFLQQPKEWSPFFDWVPRPLAHGQKFCLILFSGHRRLGDISSWLHGDGTLMPIAVDLAVDMEHGNALQCGKWERLIMSGRVSGAHGAPPCETFSSARWMEVIGHPSPQPLRDTWQPWGREMLSLREMAQCFTGTALMLVTLKLLLLTFVHGGSVSLEHPRGDPESDLKWGIWQSGLMKWILMCPHMELCTFLQGPLGQISPKPTTMLLGRMSGFIPKVYGHYQSGWKPSTYLGGKSGNQWRTARAKVYPPLLSKLIAESHVVTNQLDR
eukprot:s2648_g5.t1